METNPTISTQFHRRIADALEIGGGAQPDTGGGPAEDIAAAAKSFAETLREAEKASLDGMMGKADPQAVVTAIASAEVAVQSAVTIRDKVVESYQEILRMPV